MMSSLLPLVTRAILSPPLPSRWFFHLACDPVVPTHRGLRPVASLTLALVRGFRRHPLLMVNAVLLAAVAAAIAWRGMQVIRPGSPPPADLFIQSIATEDGDLGWRQLCPALQSQLPRDVLEEQARTQRTVQLQQGVTLSIEHVGDRSRPTGGEIRFYIATAHRADGSTGQKTYVIQTQASGCVESVA